MGSTLSAKTGEQRVLEYSIYSYSLSGALVWFEDIRASAHQSLLAMTSSTRPRECDTSRHRHGCDPPQKKSKVASLSDCKGVSNSPQSLGRLI
jgi:hypothetical protein